VLAGSLLAVRGSGFRWVTSPAVPSLPDDGPSRLDPRMHIVIGDVRDSSYYGAAFRMRRDGDGSDTLIVTALAAGAASKVKNDASSEDEDVYARLRVLIRKRLGGRSDGELTLASHGEDPATWRPALMAELDQAGAARDPGLVAAAEALMWLVDEAGARAGKYTVHMHGAQAVQAGDNNTQINTIINIVPGPQAAASSPGMPVPCWRVCVSSPSEALRGFRDAAREVITNFRYRGLGCFEPVIMEDTGARDGAGLETGAGVVRDCDLLVGIAGVCYGDHPPDDPARTSYAELEFQAAGESGLSRLVFLLDRDLAGGLERGERQTTGQADRQEIFRRRVSEDGARAVGVNSEDQFRRELGRALSRWVEESSSTKAMVNHVAAFTRARTRLLGSGARARGATTLVFGEPGTGKTTLIEALLEDVLVQRSYGTILEPVTVRLSQGRNAIEQARADVLAKLRGLAGQRAGELAVSPASLLSALGPGSVLITVYLEASEADVDPQALSVLPRLFTWDSLPVVVLAETNNLKVKNHLMRVTRWAADTLVTVGDYDNVGDALQQMRRDAPDVKHWPEIAGTLAEALGLRPGYLRDMATYIQAASHGSQSRVEVIIRQQLKAFAEERPEGAITRQRGPEERYQAWTRNRIDHMSAEARDLLALMTALHPKPTLYPEEVAIALDLSLGPDDAVRLATEGDDDDGDGDGEDAAETASSKDAEHREHAAGLVTELIDCGLIERDPGRRRTHSGPTGSQGEPPQLLTLHSAKRVIIRDHLRLSRGEPAEGYERAELFYRARIRTATESYDSRFRAENEAWWDNAGEWIYHLGYVANGRAAESYASLFLEAFWWWDCYIPSYFCGELLAYGRRPLVQEVSPDMPAVVGLLTQLRRIYPKTYDVTRARILAEIAGPDPARDDTLRAISHQGAEIVPILHQLCGRLGITELDALFTDTVTG
jgi:hypothetical protein